MYPYPVSPKPHRHVCETNKGGIPFEEVHQVCVEVDKVVFKVPYGDLCKLPCEKGIMTLAVKCLPDLTGSALPVYICDGQRSKALFYDTGVIMTGSEFLNDHYYLFFYDKCKNTVMLMNAEATPAPTIAPVG